MGHGLHLPLLVRLGTILLPVLMASACAGPGDSGVRAVAANAGSDVAASSVDAVPENERATGTVSVTATTPATGDGDVRMLRRVALTLPGAASAFSVSGVAGTLEHTFLIAFDDAGAIRLVTHKWSNADHSVVVQTSCGEAQPCAQTQVSADPSARTVSFRGLELSGLDGNTGVAARSTLTGTIR
jgi:hypothetical protein